ncbi:hypothetical protein BP5796_00766 [Coleophoma crateriformis]|uniref:BZIP domain-containing protein n=1 Tax=Coleophoma crateriformis TaxID=565419 RepID=A0A3D8T8W2_9HELO|nr:hypothetical protein BP5796_00766 [Coleophoma crateriformis]
MEGPLSLCIHAEDWTGRADRATRRKIQNRLSQRARREHKSRATHPQATRGSAPVDGPKGVTGVLKVRNDSIVRYFISDRHLGSELNPQSSQLPMALQNPTAGLPAVEQQVAHWMLYWLHKAPIDDSNRGALIHLEYTLSAPETLCVLPADHLLTLVHYNVLRAFVSNALCLGLDPKRICFELSSPFTSSDHRTIRPPPPALYPTALQQTRAHHPFIDIFPSATARDNVLSAAGDSFDEDEMWRDLFGTRFLRGNVGVKENVGLVVWGDPWRVESWEGSLGGDEFLEEGER